MAQQYSFDINAAMKAGYTPDQIAQFMDQQQKKGNSYQLTPTPQATPQQSMQPVPKSNGFADLLPTIGGVVGGIAGAALPVLGETGAGEVGGAAVGSGLGETAKELIEGQPLNAGNIAGQTALGSVGGVAGKVIGRVGSAVLPKVGQIVSKGSNAVTDRIAEDAAQSLGKATPVQWQKAAEQHGVDLNSLIKHYVPSASNYDDLLGPVEKRGNGGSIGDQLNTAEQTIQNTVKAAGGQLRLPAEDFTSALQEEARQLKMLPGNETKIDAINNFINSFAKQYKNGMSVQRALDLKRAADSKFGQAVVNDETGSTANIAQKMVANAARSNLKQLYPEMADALDQQSDLLTLKPILSRARSITKTQGSQIRSGTFANIDLTKPFNLIPAAQEALLSNPKIASTALHLGEGNLPQIPAPVGKVASQVAGQTVARNLLPTSPQEISNSTNNNGNNPSNNNNFNNSQSNTLPSSPQAAFGNNSTISSSGSQALPATPTQVGAASASNPSNPLAGYTINGQPIDSATANLIQKIANYQIDPTKMTNLRNDERQRLISLASQYDPSYDSSQFPAKQKIRNDFTSGTSAKTINSLNTAIGHLYTLSQTAKSLNNGSIPILNAGKNVITTGTGQAQVGNFNTAADAVAGEMAQVFKNSGATDSEIQSWRKNLSPDASPAQIQSNISEMIELMNSRLEALQNQYEQGLGKPADFSFLSPESQTILQSLQSNPNNLPANP